MTKKERDILENKEFGPDPDNAFMEVGAAALGDVGATEGVGLEELALEEQMQMDDMEKRELLVNPSDLQDIGDPESGDVGVVGGLAAGGEMGMGGRDHNTSDPWGSELNFMHLEMAGPPQSGIIEGEIGEIEEDKLEFEEEKI